MTQQLSKQEAFDKAARGVIAQGRASTTSNGITCQYIIKRRGKSHLHCGVGHLLADDAMRARWDEMETGIGCLGASDWRKTLEDRKASGIADLTRDFLEALQRAHDRAVQAEDEFVLQFKENMREVAKRFRVKADVLDEVPA